MKILLVEPPEAPTYPLRGSALVEPLALERIGAVVRDAEVVLLDMRCDPDLAGMMERLQPDLVGLACSFTMQVPGTLALAEQVRQIRPEAFVVVGGHPAGLRPGDLTSPAVDAVVCGEGEHTFTELADCRRQGGDVAAVAGLVLNRDGAQFATPPRALITDLDSLPHPARHLAARWRRQYFWGRIRPHALLETSRGCPHRCNFCSVWRFYGGGVRSESPTRVVDGLAAIEAEWVHFTDDNFLSSVPRARRIAELVAERGLRKRYVIHARSDTVVRHPDLLEQWADIGLANVCIGLEKATDEGLASVAKENTIASNDAAYDLLSQMGISIFGNFIVDPQWEPRDFAELQAYVRAHPLLNAGFTMLTPLPGTTLFDELESQLTTHAWERFDLYHLVTPSKLPAEQFYAEFAGLWRTAAESAPRRRRWRRVIKGIMALLRGDLDLGQLQRAQQTQANMADPRTYMT